tara:strand:- start:1730 stop:2002 length:273 start_codon:yes stop_codon:yes gene_type:complete
MRYFIELNNKDQTLPSSTEEKVTELGICLQIWQDLKKLNQMNDDLQVEDQVIYNILNQILVQEIGDEDGIVYPEYYQREATNLDISDKEE